MSPPEPPQPQDSMTATQDHADGHDLTPNTKNEAEAAFTFNSLYQTSSAGKPQPTTPLATQPTSNYLSAASAAGLSTGPPHPDPEPPYPSDGTSALLSSKPGGPLSRGTTQVILEKMESGSDLALGRRVSKEGERRTSAIKIGGEENSSGGKPGFDRRQSWNKQDLKRVMSEKLMEEDGDDFSGYSRKE